MKYSLSVNLRDRTILLKKFEGCDFAAKCVSQSRRKRLAERFPANKMRSHYGCLLHGLRIKIIILNLHKKVSEIFMQIDMKAN